MDTVSDMIIRIKNAALAGRDTVLVPQSKMRLAIAEKLKHRGYLREVVKRGRKGRKMLELTLGMTESGRMRVTDVRRVSKPGCRRYAGAHEMYSVRGGQGALIVSTPKGILLGEEAKKENVGGELLFEIW